jgi:hypothetical protein
MSCSLHAIASRILFIVMLSTFLSPNLGWHMTTSHDQLEHATTHHDQDHDEGDQHDPHAFIGHLLTHMPMSITATFFDPLSPAPTAQLTAPQFSFSPSIPEPPFRPPRPLSVV